MTADTNTLGAVSATSANGERNWTVGKRTGSSHRSARVPPSPRVRWEPLQPAKTVDDVVRNLDQIIEWAIREDSTIGYFAVLYKRSTVAVRDALNEGEFKDRQLMEHFDVVFAQRYFDALNAYFYPDEYDGLTLAWEVVFVGQELGHSTMLQHMVAGLNAHIQFDLGIVTAQLVPTALQTFEHDFKLINELVASQVRGMLKIVDRLSPTIHSIRWVIPARGKLVARILRKFRKSCWFFAIYLSVRPDKVREQTVNQLSWTAALCAWYLHPPEYWRLTPVLIRTIAKRESRDTAANLRALDENMISPDKLGNAYV
jgi:hypothetical protein